MPGTLQMSDFEVSPIDVFYYCGTHPINEDNEDNILPQILVLSLLGVIKGSHGYRHQLLKYFPPCREQNFGHAAFQRFCQS